MMLFGTMCFRISHLEWQLYLPWDYEIDKSSIMLNICKVDFKVIIFSLLTVPWTLILGGDIDRTYTVGWICNVVALFKSAFMASADPRDH